MALSQMSVREYAELQRRFGETIVEQDGMYWRRVRRFFYRPVLQIHPLAPTQARFQGSWANSFQYVLPGQEGANSNLGFLVLDDLKAYSLTSVDTRRRYLIKQGAKAFAVREITDPVELKKQGHSVYLSFFQRTQYAYKSERQESSRFDGWVDTLFTTPKVLILGGYGEAGLAAVSTSYWIDSTLILATFFGDSAAMKRNVGEIMLHELRLRAGQVAGIEEIFLRPYQGGNSLDRYYMIRGGKLVQKPARLEMPGPIRFAMRTMMPERYAQLLGQWPATPEESK